MEYINTGEKPNDGTGDTINIATEKINKNFYLLFKKLNIDEPAKIIVWNTLEDTKQVMDDINYNFNKLQKDILITKKGGDLVVIIDNEHMLLRLQANPWTYKVEDFKYSLK